MTFVEWVLLYDYVNCPIVACSFVVFKNAIKKIIIRRGLHCLGYYVNNFVLNNYRHNYWLIPSEEVFDSGGGTCADKWEIVKIV